MSDLHEKISSMLAVSVVTGMQGAGGAFKDVFCQVSGRDAREADVLSMMATTARLMAIQIVLAKGGVGALGGNEKDVADLLLAVQKSVLAAHVISGALKEGEAARLFPQLGIGEFLGKDWEKGANESSLAAALTMLSKFSAQGKGTDRGEDAAS